MELAHRVWHSSRIDERDGHPLTFSSPLDLEAQSLESDAHGPPNTHSLSELYLSLSLAKFLLQITFPIFSRLSTL